MELLNELLNLQGSMLNEDLGELKKLGLGKMVNALKQTYYSYTSGRGSNKHQRIATDTINKTLVRHKEILNNSPIYESPIKAKNWDAVKKAWKKIIDSEGPDKIYPGAIAFYYHDKPVALLIGYWDNFQRGGRDTVGLAWDFTHTPLSDEQVAEIIGEHGKGGLIPGPEKDLYSDKVTIHKHPRKSAQVHETYDKWYGKTTVSHYEGVSQTGALAKEFLNRLGAATNGEVTMKFIGIDTKTREIRYERNKNPAPTKEDMKLFKDDIKVRLAKYKNSKIQSVDTLQEFVAKVFEGGLKKIVFAGRAYNAIPESYTFGTNKSKPAPQSHPTRYYVNDTMQRLFKGEAVEIKFAADRAEGDYNSLTLMVKFKNGMLVPVKARYNDKADGDWGSSKEITF